MLAAEENALPLNADFVLLEKPELPPKAELGGPEAGCEEPDPNAFVEGFEGTFEKAEVDPPKAPNPDDCDADPNDGLPKAGKEVNGDDPKDEVAPKAGVLEEAVPKADVVPKAGFPWPAALPKAVMEPNAGTLDVLDASEEEPKAGVLIVPIDLVAGAAAAVEEDASTPLEVCDNIPVYMSLASVLMM